MEKTDGTGLRLRKLWKTADNRSVSETLTGGNKKSDKNCQNQLKSRRSYGKLIKVSLGGAVLDILRIVLTVIYVIDCVALTVVVLMQEGKQQGLGAIAGIADTYWGKNKGRSAEGALIRATKIMAVLFIILSMVLNMNF